MRIPIKDFIKNAEYHRKYDKKHRKDINKNQRIRRAKKKMELELKLLNRQKSEALFEYECAILPVRTENWRIKNAQK